MMRWYALQLYEFLRNDWHCKYKYGMRMGEESFIYFPIRYDMFEFMATHKYQNMDFACVPLKCDI